MLASMSDLLELPRPWRLVRTFTWSLAEAAGLPLGMYLTGNAVAGRDAGMLAGLATAWLIVGVRKLACGKVPGLVTLSAVVLCVQTVLVFATGQAWIYLLQVPLAKLSLSLLFARSAPTEHPLVSRLATEVMSLRHGDVSHPGLHRFFQRVTWLWAVIFGLLAIVFAALAVTQPAAFFLLASTGITAIAVGSGAGASAWWFSAVLRRNGLRLAFARTR